MNYYDNQSIYDDGKYFNTSDERIWFKLDISEYSKLEGIIGELIKKVYSKFLKKKEDEDESKYNDLGKHPTETVMQMRINLNMNDVRKNQKLTFLRLLIF